MVREDTQCDLCREGTIGIDGHEFTVVSLFSGQLGSATQEEAQKM